MRRPLLTVFVVVTVAVAFVAWRAAKDVDTPTESGPERASPSRDRDAPSSTTKLASDVARPSTTNHAPTLTVHLVGRVVDERGAPIADARAWAFGLDGVWSKDVALPELHVRGGVVLAYSATTDADGRFAIDAPVPTARRVRVEVETADHRGRLVRDLVATPSATTPGITAGENDLGTLVVPVRGAILGRALEPGGAPVANASVLLERGTQSAGSCATEADGSFVLACVPSGSFTLTSTEPDHLDAKLEGVELGAGEVKQDVELVLDRVPTIRGVVVDQNANPLASIYIVGSGPSGRMKSGCATQTRADGSFMLRLRDRAPHDLAIESGRCLPWSSHAIEPDSELRIQLTRLDESVVTVVDAATREPIRRFGLANVDEQRARLHSVDRGVQDVPLPDSMYSEDGRRTVVLQRPPQDVVVHGAGHVPRVVRLQDVAEQTIELAPQGSIRGRVTHDGAPAERARVVARPLEADPEREAWFPLDLGRSDERLSRDARRSVGPSGQVVIAGLDGSFEIGDLDPGRYAVLAAVAGSSAAAHVLSDEVLVRDGKCLDVGVLELPAARSSLRVTFVLDRGKEVGGLFNHVVAQLNGAQLGVFDAPPIAPNVYSLHDLPPGAFVLSVGRYLVGPPRVFRATLVDGVETELAVDLRGFALCRVQVRFADPRIAGDSFVYAVFEDGGSKRDVQFLGSAGDDEEVSRTGPVIGGTHVVFEARTWDGRVVASTGPLEVPSSETFTATLVAKQ